MSGPGSKITTIIISRTDSIGDVVLTLPMAGVIKKNIPGCRVLFLGRNYTKAVIACSQHVDGFLNWDELQAMKPSEAAETLRLTGADAILHVFPVKDIAKLAARAKIRIRVGTTHRLYHLLTCNRLISFSRRKSQDHEGQLNLRLLPGIGIEQKASCEQLNEFTGFTRVPLLPDRLAALLAPGKFNLVLHPRSKGSAREWGLENYSRLIRLLPEEKFKIFISGTKEEGESMKAFIESNSMATDLTGKLSLEELIAFLHASHGIVAASTGPLHLASALGIKAIGIYSPMIPIHPGRWAPIGVQAQYLVKQKSCSDCRKNNDCHCIREITPEEVMEKL